jgi:hypothetical protein
MLIGARGGLDSIACSMKNNLSDEDFSEFSRSIARSMSAPIDISSVQCGRFPDIAPGELTPPGD